MTTRTDSLDLWIKQHLQIDEYSIAPASSDASFRQYFRIDSIGSSQIIMDAPPDKEDSAPFVAIAGLLLDAGLNVPQVIDADLTQGYLLLSDLGNQQYLQALNTETVDQLYRDAFNALNLMQVNVVVDADSLPVYDAELLKRELELFREWFLEKHLAIKLDTGQHQMIDKAFEFLIESALSQPVVCVHRDYHSRNLMLTSDNNPGVLDFQDAVFGPVTYDLVSLLRDCYIAWPREQVESWVSQYFNQFILNRQSCDFDEKQFLRWFDLMGVQRHLKAIGIFARLNIRDGKPGYLNDIPRTLSYVLDVCRDYSELQAFHQFLVDEVQPGMNERK